MRDDANAKSQIRQFWQQYAESVGVKRKVPSVMRLGDSDELADELAMQVLAGTKRAHANLPRDFTAQGRAFPKRGDLNVVTDGSGAPRCVVRCVQVEVKPMRDADEQFAWDSGGGDRTLQWWINAHMRYFRRRGVREGFLVGPETELVFERFEVVWPNELADARKRAARAKRYR